jgi:two-component system NarL family response regulator
MTDTNHMDAQKEISVEFLQTVFLQAGDGIFLVDDQKIIAANPCGCEMFGYSNEEIIGLPLMEKIPADEIEHITAKLGLLVVTKFVVSESAFYRKDGSRMEVEISGRMLSNGHILGFMRDITERKQAEKVLREAQARFMENEREMATLNERERLARELHDSIGQTFGYISMQSEAVRGFISRGDIDGALPLLARLSEVAQESHHDLRVYIQGLQSHSSVIHQEFFAALERYCQHYEQSYLFEVELRLPRHLPEVLANVQVETHLIYIIREAMGNARRYSGEKRASVSIVVENEFVQAIIEDHDVGFKSQYNRPERRKGMHFGLRIMCERAEEVGGSVVVESELGQGTRVIARLPRKLSSGETLTARILVVDDHPLFIDGLRNMLGARGVHVIGVARNGLEARKLARTLNPDLILMDINMPYMNGLEATRLIKAEMPEVKIAMLTTSMAEEDVFEALRVGASGYLPKGMSGDEFMLRLGEIARGEAEFSAEMAGQLLAMFAEKTSQMAELTERQSEILRLVAHGLTYREIGERLYLTERTVKYHMGEILSRLHLKGRQEAEEYAKRRGLA